MKIAFLADPLAGFKTYKDSTFAMMREAVKRGHAIYAFEQSDMALEEGIVSANIAHITLTGHPEDWFVAAPSGAWVIRRMPTMSAPSRLLLERVDKHRGHIETALVGDLLEAGRAGDVHLGQAIADNV